MEQNKYAKIVSETLTGIIEGVFSAREESVESGVLIAPGRKQIEAEFHLSFYGDSYLDFKIPVAIPAFPATAGTDGNPDIPVTPDTKISDTGLPTRVRNGLRTVDIETVRDLIAITDSDSLLRIHQIGHASIREIEAFLSRHGLYPEWTKEQSYN
jgi:hypothetical protein